MSDFKKEMDDKLASSQHQQDIIIIIIIIMRMCRMEKVPGHGICPDLSGPGRPARSRQIFDPATIPGKTSIPRHFLLENRSLVDFTERK